MLSYDAFFYLPDGFHFIKSWTQLCVDLAAFPAHFQFVDIKQKSLFSFYLALVVIFSQQIYQAVFIWKTSALNDFI